MVHCAQHIISHLIAHCGGTTQSSHSHQWGIPPILEVVMLGRRKGAYNSGARQETSGKGRQRQSSLHKLNVPYPVNEPPHDQVILGHTFTIFLNTTFCTRANTEDELVPKRGSTEI